MVHLYRMSSLLSLAHSRKTSKKHSSSIIVVDLAVRGYVRTVDIFLSVLTVILPWHTIRVHTNSSFVTIVPTVCLSLSTVPRVGDSILILSEVVYRRLSVLSGVFFRGFHCYVSIQTPPIKNLTSLPRSRDMRLSSLHLLTLP